METIGRLERVAWVEKQSATGNLLSRSGGTCLLSDYPTGIKCCASGGRIDVGKVIREYSRHPTTVLLRLGFIRRVSGFDM